MRTIKFRGIDTMSGEMVYGDLAQQKLTNGSITTAIVQTYATYDVNSKTIGQFTGLFDKNGKEIYEGDIVKCDKFVYEVVFEEKRFASYGLCRKGDMFMHYFGEAMESQQCEVIGNIHDNKELIKEK